jgi:hypothetical protein
MGTKHSASAGASGPATTSPAVVGELDQELRSYILLLRDEHRQQIEHLERTGKRITLWTFAGGVLLGFLGNVVVAVLMS